MKKTDLLRLCGIMLAFSFLPRKSMAQQYDRYQEGVKFGMYILGELTLDDAHDKGPSFDGVKDKPGIGGGAAVRFQKPLGGGGEGLSNSVENGLFIPAKRGDNGYFYLSGELAFKLKSTKESDQGQTTTISLWYLQLPVLINYSYPLSDMGSLHFGAGPYAAMGLFGSFSGGGSKETVHFGTSDNDDLKRMDYGIAMDAGYSFLKKWDVTLNYDIGLRQVSATPPDPTTKIRGFCLKIGYKIR